MGYQKINVELIVFSEEAAAVVTKLNSAIDWIEESYAIFGGGIETVPVEHSGTRRKSVLRRTLDVRDSTTTAVKSATQKVVNAYRKVI